MGMEIIQLLQMHQEEIILQMRIICLPLPKGLMLLKEMILIRVRQNHTILLNRMILRRTLIITTHRKVMILQNLMTHLRTTVLLHQVTVPQNRQVEVGVEAVLVDGVEGAIVLVEAEAGAVAVAIVPVGEEVFIPLAEAGFITNKISKQEFKNLRYEKQIHACNGRGVSCSTFICPERN